MIGGIDHVVIAVDDPDAVAASLEQTLGVRASGGGRHERLGTFNRLVWLGDSYLELVGVFDRTMAETSWLGRPVVASLDRGGGLATWAVAIDDLAGHLRWTASGATLTRPIEGERRRPDGRMVRWRLSHSAALSPELPFLIEHDSTAAEWTPDERRARAAEAHPIGAAIRLGSLAVAVASPPSAAAALRSLLGTTVEPVGRRTVRVTMGEQFVRFVPADGASARAIVELAAEIPLRRQSARIGNCELRIRGRRPDSRLV